MKFKILILCFFFSLSSSSQTLDETIDWIGSNSEGLAQVMYDESTGVLTLIKVQHLGPRSIMAFVSEIDPKAVASIDIKYGSDEWNDIQLNFKTGGTNVKSYTVNKDWELTMDPINTRMFGFDINLKTSRDYLPKFKKAYLHLFRQIGITVKDGDMF